MFSNPVTVNVSQPAAISVVNSIDVTPTTTSAVAVPANPNRKALYAWNDSNASVLLDLDGTVATTSFLGRLDVGGQFSLEPGRNGVYLGDVSIISTSANPAGKVYFREAV